MNQITTAGITQRENEILDHISEGLTNKEIAARLFISRATVETHVKNIFLKLGVHNRIEAINKTRWDRQFFMSARPALAS